MPQEFWDEMRSTSIHFSYVGVTSSASSMRHVIVCRPRDRPHAFPRGVFQTTTGRTDDHHDLPDTNFHQEHQHIAISPSNSKKKRKIASQDHTSGPDSLNQHPEPHHNQPQTCRAVPKSRSQSATSPSPTSSTSKCGRPTSATGSGSPNSRSQSSSRAPGNAAPVTSTRRKPVRLLRNSTCSARPLL